MFEVLALDVFPGVAIIMVYWYKRRDSFEDFHAYGLAIFSSLVLCNLTMSLIKKASGRPRPDFIARCAPACMENMTWICAPDRDLYDATCENDCCPVQCGINDKRYPELVECSFIQNGVDFSDAVGGVLTTCGHFLNIPLTEEAAECRGYEGSG